MRLIVTRPEPDATGLAAALAARGHHVLAAPLLAVGLAAPGTAIPERPYQACLVTSANGVRAAAANAAFARLRRLPAIAVGRASADAARAAGFSAVTGSGGDLPALVATVRTKLDPAAGPLLYLSGEVTSGDLAAELGRAGFETDRVVLYRAEPAAYLPEPVTRALGAGEVDGVLLYSPRTARIWADLVQAAGLSAAAGAVVHYCLSDNVARAVHAGLGPEVPCRIAGRPEDSALLALLQAGS